MDKKQSFNGKLATEIAGGAGDNDSLRWRSQMCMTCQQKSSETIDVRFLMTLLQHTSSLGRRYSEIR